MNIGNTKQWLCEGLYQRIEEESKDCFPSLLEVHLQISKKDPELNQQKVSWSLILLLSSLLNVEINGKEGGRSWLKKGVSELQV